MKNPVKVKNLIGKEVLINQVGCYGINLGKIDFYLSEDNIKEKSSSFKV
jgi:5'-nucleotidase